MDSRTRDVESAGDGQCRTSRWLPDASPLLEARRTPVRIALMAASLDERFSRLRLNPWPFSGGSTNEASTTHSSPMLVDSLAPRQAAISRQRISR